VPLQLSSKFIDRYFIIINHYYPNSKLLLGFETQKREKDFAVSLLAYN
jgi:hypothetical protein